MRSESIIIHEDMCNLTMRNRNVVSDFTSMFKADAGDMYFVSLLNLKLAGFPGY